MNDLWQGATVFVMLIVVLAVVALAGYSEIKSPDAKTTGELIGALLSAFGIVVTHLFNSINGSRPKE